MPSLHVKYCGGCRSGYDRVAWFRGVLSAMRALDGSIVLTDNEAGADIRVAVCGCPAQCVSVRTCSMPRTWMGSVWNPAIWPHICWTWPPSGTGGTNSIAYQLVTKEMSVKERRGAMASAISPSLSAVILCQHGFRCACGDSPGSCPACAAWCTLHTQT